MTSGFDMFYMLLLSTEDNTGNKIDLFNCVI